MLHGLLLSLLLPRRRRARYGGEMRAVFAELHASVRRERGALAVMKLWRDEIGGLMRFSWREWMEHIRKVGRDFSPASRASGGHGPRPPLSTELRWAWRGVRARGWRAVFIVLLLGVALSVNAVVFSAADAFVFRTIPYHAPQELVIIERTGPNRLPTDSVAPQAFAEWRNHRDLFAGLQAHVHGGVAYLTLGGVTEPVRAERVTPGLFELLGVLPRWGRPFTIGDAAAGAPPSAVIGESLARRLFGSPAAAVSRTISTGQTVITVIGVMPAHFRFPTAREEIWYPLDLSTWPNNSRIRDIARLAPGVTVTSAAAAVVARAEAVLRVVELRSKGESMQLRSMADVRGNVRATAMFAMLAGAAGCLLLIACANVASLEMAAAARRLRIYAVQTALGASRASLIRVGLFEGALILTASAIVAATLATWGTTLLDRQLTAAMRDALTNPLDIDPRVLAFMITVASATWMLTSLPGIWRVARLSIVDGLRDDPRTMPVARGAARSRQWLMAGQVALTSLLLVGALLYMRTYAARLGLDKRFDASNMATVEVSPAPDAAKTGVALGGEILDRLRAMPGVIAVSRTNSLPPSTQSGLTAKLMIDGRAPTDERLMLHGAVVDPDYFKTMGIPVVAGRAFDATSEPDQVVVDERFARKYWPDGSPLGARFRMAGGGFNRVTDFHIVGVSRQIRPDRLQTDVGEDVYVLYLRSRPDSELLTFVARVDDERRVADIGAVVRAIADRSFVRTDTVSARYARLDADTRLAAAVTGGFGFIALIVATSGVYAVMAFLVAGRSKEIAIRMALGADRAGVQRLVFGTSLRFVIAGAAVGLVAAGLASQAIAAQLYGVTATDPATYAMVAALVLGAAVISTWWPARRASRVDPAVTLRSE